MNKPMVSVIMLAYKHAAFISQAIDSVLKQNVDFTIEIIIGDDCSCDGSAEIIMQYYNKYPTIIIPVINPVNVGANFNLLNVYKKCRGKYIANLECDDYWCDENKLQKQVDFLEENPDYSATGSNYYLVSEDGGDSKIALMKYECNKTYIMNDYLNNGMVMHTNTLVYRNYIVSSPKKYEDVLTAIPTMGDVFGRCSIYNLGKAYCFYEPSLCHRITKNVTGSFQASQVNSANKYTKMMLELIPILNSYFDNRYDFMHLACNRMAMLYFDHKMKRVFLDLNEYKKIMNTLPSKYKRETLFKILRVFATKLKRILYRKVIMRNSKDYDK